MFPPKDTNSLGQITAVDIANGLKNMGFELAPKKFQFVITILGLSQALADGRSIHVNKLKTSILHRRLEEHHEKEEWKKRGGNGELVAKYKGRTGNNNLDEDEDLFDQQAEKPIDNVVMSLSPNAREMLSKLGDRFSTVRRAFRTMDKDKSGNITRVELKNILDTFCLPMEHEEFEQLMNHFDSDHDGYISYEEFLSIVANEIQPQILAGNAGLQQNGDVQPQKPSNFDENNKRRPKRQFQTEYSSSYVRPGYIPLKSLDELKIYHDFIKKISTEFKSLEEAFMAIDIHREGYITKDELKEVLDNFAFKMSNSQFEALVNVFDTDHDGKISFREFLQQVKHCNDEEAAEEEDARIREMLEFDKSPAAQRRLQKIKSKTKKLTSYEFLMEKIWENSDTIHEAFKKMDTDRSGSLSAAELKSMLDSYAFKVPDEVFANMLGLFDSDGDGEISYHEFMTQVKRSVAGKSGYVDAGSADAGDDDGNEEGGASPSSGGVRKPKMTAAERKKVAKRKKTLKALLSKIGEKFNSVRKAFMEMDKDKSGTLDYEELRMVLESTGYKIDDDIFDDVLEVFDKDCDGEVDYHEFLEQLEEHIGAAETGGIGNHLAGLAGRNLGRKGALQTGELSAVEKAASEKAVGAALSFLCEKVRQGREEGGAGMRIVVFSRRLSNRKYIKCTYIMKKPCFLPSERFTKSG